MPFTPGILTESQARELNQLQRDVKALQNLTVTPPLRKTNAAGCVNLSVAPTPLSLTGFWAAIYDDSGLSGGGLGTAADQWYSWRRVEYVADLPNGQYSGLPSYVDPGDVPTPLVYTANSGVRNLHVVNRTDAVAGGFTPYRTRLFPGRVVWIEPAGKVKQLGQDVPLYVTDSDDRAAYQFSFLVPFNTPLPANTTINTITIYADNLRMASSFGYLTPLSPPAPSPGPGH